MKDLIKFLSTVIFMSLISLPSLAASSILDNHSFKLGGYAQKGNIKITAVRRPFNPIEIDFIDDFGMDETSTSAFASYRWHFTNKWSLSVAYQQLELEGKGIAAKSFNFAGRDFTAGVRVDTEYSMDTYLVDIGYSFIRNEKWEVLIGLGVHAFDIETSIAGQASITNGVIGVGTQAARVNAEVLAPLPNLRGSVTYGITPKWEISASSGWLSLAVDDIDGNYTFLDIGTEYRFTKRFGIGANYQLANIEVTSDESNGEDVLDLEFTGPSLYFTYNL